MGIEAAEIYQKLHASKSAFETKTAIVVVLLACVCCCMAQQSTLIKGRCVPCSTLPKSEPL